MERVRRKPRVEPTRRKGVPAQNRRDLTVHACAFQKQLQPFVAETPQEQWKLPAFCYPDSKVPNDPEVKAKGLEFVIATVPNPTLTHLPLMFDRLIEIMQQAAQDNQYSYDSSWLPWSEGKE